MFRPLILATALAFAAAPALAHDHDFPLPTDITIDEALQIARDAGAALIGDVEFDDGIWEIEARDANGNRLEIHVDGATGEIVRQ